MFVVKDGALAWEVKKFLLTQDNCELITIEGKDYYNEKSQVFRLKMVVNDSAIWSTFLNK